MESLLATTIAFSPDFDQASALGRIHSILSALIEHCKTRPAYLYTGCFTCELQIRSQGDAFVLPVIPDYEVKAELLRVWELVQGTDISGGVPVSPSLPQVIPESYQLRPARAIEPSIAPNAFEPREPPAHLLSWAIVAPFALFCAFRIFYNIFLPIILPIAFLVFLIAVAMFLAVISLFFPPIVDLVSLIIILFYAIQPHR